MYEYIINFEMVQRELVSCKNMFLILLFMFYAKKIRSIQNILLNSD